MTARKLLRLFLVGLLCLFVASHDLRHAAFSQAHAFVRSGLWRVVHNICAPMQENVGLPLPCLDVDTAHGFAILRAPTDRDHILVVPTRKVTGIESPVLQAPTFPNIWAYAWKHRGLIAEAARRKLAWNEVGMAVNSAATRTQDQLHIHVDCVDPRLKAVLQKTPLSRDKWRKLDLRPWAGRYFAKRIDGDKIRQNIFAMIAREIPGAADNMADESVAIVGFVPKKGERGFVVLENSYGGHAEQLLDHDCAATRAADPTDKGT